MPQHVGAGPTAGREVAGGWALLWAAAAVGLSLLVSAGAPRAALVSAVSAAAAVAAGGALLVHRPRPAWPWLCLCAGLGSHAVGDLADLSAALGVPLQVLGRSADVATSACAMATAVLFLLSRHPDAALDAGVALLGAALFTTAQPVAALLGGDRVFGAGLAAELVGLMVIGGIIVFGSRGRPPSLYLLLGAALAAFSGSLLQLVPAAPQWRDLPALLAPVFAAAATVHPSMVRLVKPVAATERGIGPIRLVVVGTALVAYPAILLAEALRTSAGIVAPIGFVLLTLLVLMRVGGLLAERERIQAAYLDSEHRFRALVQHAFDVIAVLDGRGVVGYVSPSAGRVLGRPQHACVGRRLCDLVAAADASLVQAAVDAVQANPTGVSRIEVSLEQPDGGVRWGDVLLANRLDDPTVGGIVVNLRDVTERKQAELELSRLALHDPLTGLPNRVRLLERIRAASEAGAAVLFCDLDGFKAVNDRHGHDLGDHLLIAVADRLRDALRGEDEATRLGGDEFVILCSGVVSEAQVSAIARRLRARICEPFALRGAEVRIGCSIGIATAPRPGLRPEDLLEAADRAMYRAKRLRAGIAVHHWGEEASAPIDLTEAVAR